MVEWSWGRDLNPQPRFRKPNCGTHRADHQSARSVSYNDHPEEKPTTRCRSTPFLSIAPPHELPNLDLNQDYNVQSVAC